MYELVQDLRISLRAVAVSSAKSKGSFATVVIEKSLQRNALTEHA